jgi:hypothetical protein
MPWLQLHHCSPWGVRAIGQRRLDGLDQNVGAVIARREKCNPAFADSLAALFLGRRQSTDLFYNSENSICHDRGAHHGGTGNGLTDEAVRGTAQTVRLTN